MDSKGGYSESSGDGYVMGDTDSIVLDLPGGGIFIVDKDVIEMFNIQSIKGYEEGNPYVTSIITRDGRELLQVN